MTRGLATPRVSVNADLCRGCDMCMLACSLHHHGQCTPSLARLRVTKDIDRYHFRISICEQCAQPACFEVCPVPEAMERSETGVVTIIEENCIACGSCMEACSFGVIWHHEELDIYLKCDLCHGRDAGPLCVEVCPTGALLHQDDQGE